MLAPYFFTFHTFHEDNMGSKEAWSHRLVEFQLVRKRTSGSKLLRLKVKAEDDVGAARNEVLLERASGSPFTDICSSLPKYPRAVPLKIVCETLRIVHNKSFRILSGRKPLFR